MEEKWKTLNCFKKGAGSQMLRIAGQVYNMIKEDGAIAETTPSFYIKRKDEKKPVRPTTYPSNFRRDSETAPDWRIIAKWVVEQYQEVKRSGRSGSEKRKTSTSPGILSNIKEFRVTERVSGAFSKRWDPPFPFLSSMISYTYPTSGRISPPLRGGREVFPLLLPYPYGGSGPAF